MWDQGYLNENQYRQYQQEKCTCTLKHASLFFHFFSSWWIQDEFSAFNRLIGFFFRAWTMYTYTFKYNDLTTFFSTSFKFKYRDFKLGCYDNWVMSLCAVTSSQFFQSSSVHSAKRISPSSLLHWVCNIIYGYLLHTLFNNLC